MFHLILALIWAASVVLIYGLSYAYFRATPSLFETEEMDKGLAALSTLCYALLGPCGLVCVFLLTNYGEHGLRFK